MDSFVNSILNTPFMLLEGMISLVLVLASIPILRRLAPKFGLIDHPGGRKRQCTPTPLVGGTAIFLSATIALYSSGVFFQLQGLILGSAALFLVGLLDDRFDLQASLRFILQALIVSVALAIDDIWLASLGQVSTFELKLGFLQYPVTILAVLGVINAINMLDGLDGLASGIAMLTLFFILGFSITSNSEITVIASTLFGATLGFWLYNYRFSWRQKASVYMGDSGTLPLGFILSYIAIYLTISSKVQPALEPAYLLWLFALPLWDITTVLYKRMLSGRSPFIAGRDHIHHILLNTGFSVRQTVIVIYGITLLGISVGTSLYYFGFGVLGLYAAFLVSLLVYVKIVMQAEKKNSADVVYIDAARKTKEHNKRSNSVKR